MPFTVNNQYRATVIEIRGKFLGSVEGPHFKETLQELKDAGKTNVVADLSEAEFIDSTGIGVLIGGLTTLRKAGGDMRLAGLEKRIKDVFLMTKLLGGVFDEYDNAEDAVRSFQQNPPAESPKSV